MNYFLLYLILKLDILSEISLVAVIITGVVSAIALLITAINYNDEEAKSSAKPWVTNFGISFIIALFLIIMIPNTQQAAVVYCLPKIVNNEQVQKMPDNLLKLANQWLDGQITETTETVTETVVKSVEN
jgi:hypothetical protein